MRFLHDLKMITQEQNKKRTPQSLEPTFEKPINTTLWRNSLFSNMIGQSKDAFLPFYGFLWQDWRQALPDKTTDKRLFKVIWKLLCTLCQQLSMVNRFRYKHNVVINVLPVLDSNNTNDEIVSQAEFAARGFVNKISNFWAFPRNSRVWPFNQKPPQWYVHVVLFVSSSVFC